MTIKALQKLRDDGVKIAVLTCYDASFAAMLDAAGLDSLLVGDSLGMVLQGHDTTLPVTLADMAYHTRSVAQGSKRSFLVTDMPFGSYQESPQQAFRSAAELMADPAILIFDDQSSARSSESRRSSAPFERSTTSRTPARIAAGRSPLGARSFTITTAVVGRDCSVDERAPERDRHRVRSRVRLELRDHALCVGLDGLHRQPDPPRRRFHEACPAALHVSRRRCP